MKEGTRGAAIRTVLVGGIAALAMLLFCAFVMLHLRSNRQAAEQFASRLNEELAQAIKLHLDDYLDGPQPSSQADAALAAALPRLLSGPSIDRQGLALLVDAAGHIQASSRSAQIPAQMPTPAMQASLDAIAARSGWPLHLDRPLQYSFELPHEGGRWRAQALPYAGKASQLDWIIITALPDSDLAAPPGESAVELALLGLLALVLATMLGAIMARAIRAPIGRMAGWAEAAAHGEPPPAPVRPSPLRELQALSNAVQALALQARESTRRGDASEQALRVANEQLQLAHAQLRELKEQQAQSQRLAELGANVAAVAHELNSPIGICVTVASTLQDETHTFEQQFASGELRRSQLKFHLSSLREGFQLLNRGLSKARELISNFKRIAVDKGAVQKRQRFDLRRTIEELQELIRITLDKTPYRLEIEVPVGIFMEGFPGAIEQVVTNLVNNAVAHAFAGWDHGLMRLSAVGAGGFVTMRFIDDGCGMSPEVLRRVFDPFFTTALGKGGSGLGMSISYELITGPLGGNIEVISEIDQGTQFIITLPRVAPVGHGALGDVLPLPAPSTPVTLP